MEPTVKFSSFWRRVAAALIDLIFQGIILSLMGIAVYNAWIGTFGAGYGPNQDASLMVLAVSLLLSWAYAFAFETDNGAEPGKRLLGLRVARLDGSRPGPLRITARWLLHILSLVILGIGFLMPLWTKNKQTLHDLLTDTVVVRTETGE
jgi:uncharacterized RDD family membrane protein YckC